ncbi:MAG: PQQ-binding-like beta-propeller repeat protein [Methanotrichaceae archaeon]|nr:PQQ-binding-like beta-propeller repeat protein [Methanotrichaceae archaeon]
MIERPIFILLLASVFVISSASAEDWPLFKKDASNSGITQDPVPDDPVLIWSANIQRMETAPTISSNLVYALAGNGSVWAFDKETGRLKWRSQLEGWVFQMSPLASGGDRIFAATDSGLLAAFDALTGRLLWKQDLTDKRFEGPLNYIDGRIYLGEGSAYGLSQKRFFCLDQNGTECWNVTRSTKGYQWCGAAQAGDYLVFGQNDGRILSVNRLSGEVADELHLNDSSRLSFSREPGRIRASAAFKDGYIYTASEVSAEGGFAWKIGLDPDSGRFEDRGWSSSIGFSTSTPSVYNGRVYLGVGEHGHPGALVCLNDSSGDTIWTYPVEAGVKSSPSISSAHDSPRILFTTAQVDGYIYCIEDSGRNGTLLWKLNPPDPGYLLGGIALSEGRVYFGTEGDQHFGKLYCLGDEEGDEEGWPQFHSNPQHLGYSTSSAPKSNRTAWISDVIGAQAGASVSVAGGKLFVNCISNITCLDQNSGKVLWTFPFNSSGDYAFGFTPVYSEGQVFFTSDRTYCLNASDGREIWSFSQPTGKFAVDGSPAAAGGKVVASDWDGHHYYCLDEETGDELWSFTVKGNAQSTPAIDQGKAVFGSWDWGMGGRIYCLDLDNGSEIWNLTTDNSPCGSAAIYGGVVYMATYNFEGEGDILALSLDRGSVLWKAAVSATDSTPAVADGRVYLCSGCEGFSDLVTYCFNASSGELIWNTPPEEKIGDWRCSPAYADGLLFAGRAQFTEYAGTLALNATTGDIVWSYPGGGSSPAVAGGMLFTAGSGRVYAFSDDLFISGGRIDG